MVYTVNKKTILFIYKKWIDLNHLIIIIISFRKSNDYTQYYGETPDPGKLSGHIIDNLKAHSLVLDGEMMTYDPKLDVFLPFGGLRTAALGKVK